MQTQEETFDVPSYLTADRKVWGKYFVRHRLWNEWGKPIVGALVAIPLIYGFVYFYLAVMPVLFK